MLVLLALVLGVGGAGGGADVAIGGDPDLVGVLGFGFGGLTAFFGCHVGGGGGCVRVAWDVCGGGFWCVVVGSGGGLVGERWMGRLVVGCG